MIYDESFFGTGRSDWARVENRSDYQDEHVEIAQQRTKRAAIRRILYEAYRATGPITREGNLLSGGGQLYKIVSGEAQVVIEIMLERKEIVESKKPLNKMGKKPTEI